MAVPKLLTKSQLEKELKSLEFFSAVAKDSKLSASFSFSSHVNALVFIARITVHAEVQQHHPEITFTHAHVKVVLTTHDSKGITAKDITLAKKIESLRRN